MNKIYEIDVEQIQKHYEKACKKHPVFCEKLLIKNSNEKEKTALLALSRIARKKDPCGQTVMGEELSEIYEAYIKGEKEHAIDECYDAIAVLLRFVDFIKGEM